MLHNFLLLFSVLSCTICIVFAWECMAAIGRGNAERVYGTLIGFVLTGGLTVLLLAGASGYLVPKS